MENDKVNSPPIELWGGIEATVNRVGDQYFNQLIWSGHVNRPDDCDRFADLGIQVLRYPVVWEMMQPDESCVIEWSLADQSLARLRSLGVKPILGLVHHGSGPVYAPVDSPRFAPGLASYARRVAERYPWVSAYTPVNEPLTTARFCGSYGLWYPHGRTHRTFARIVANECRATVLAMEEIRKVNPQAKLIQTDDLGKIYGTASLADEVAFQNHRRWLAWDLICGRVTNDHPLWDYLRRSGLSRADLKWFLENPCPPDVIGINHYPTSDRFLDERHELYGECALTDNGRRLYADVEAVRVRPESVGGFHERLMEAWDRYHLPLAITESHLGCTREEQIRWFGESWNAALQVRRNGADVVAVTAWSLLGSFNWDTLVTHDSGVYEPGVFDVRGSEPRPTAIASVLRAISAGESPTHPALEQPGWWRRPERLFETHRALAGRGGQRRQLRPSPDSRKLLVLGATGTLGSAFVEACKVRGWPYLAFSRQDLDLTDPVAIEAKIQEIRPWTVINATGYVRVDDAECDESTCFEVNTLGAARLAEACERHGASLLCFSSDLVFDGKRHCAYVESNETSPLNAYGRSKAEMERRVLGALPSALIARTSAFFGPLDQWNFLTQTLRALHRGECLKVAEDVIVSPTYIPDLVSASFDLLIDGVTGIWHLANQGEVSWAELARMAAKECGVSEAGLENCSAAEVYRLAERPAYSVLGTERGRLMPSLEKAIADYAKAVSFAA